jgi:adenylate cyclase
MNATVPAIVTGESGSGITAVPNAPVILAVDDDDTNLLALRRPLTKEGYKLITALSGSEALDILGKMDIDIILMDWMMPEMTGLDVCRILKKDPRLKLIPLILVTAKAGSSDIMEGLDAGANDYITKPVDRTELLARVRAGLRERAIQKDLKESNDRLLALNNEIQNLNEGLERRNRFIRRVFGRYLSDGIVNSLLETPDGLKLGGEKRKVTIMMSDLRGFSILSERMPPESVVNLLNNHLSKMTDIIDEYGGTIDEFIGDAILVIFGAPQNYDDSAERGVACALAMQLAMDEVNRKSEAEGLPRVEMGVGVDTGEVIVGNIGSRKRAKYGVVGRHVNLAARIESFTTGGQILISQSTYDEVAPIVRLFGQMTIAAKGSSEPVMIYDVAGLGGRHDLNLPERRLALHDLALTAVVEIAVMKEKFSDDVFTPGEILRSSDKAVEIRVQLSLCKYDNIKLKLAESGAGSGECFYGKVSETHDDGNIYIVSLTYIPPEIRRWLESLEKK